MRSTVLHPVILGTKNNRKVSASPGKPAWNNSVSNKKAKGGENRSVSPITAKSAKNNNREENANRSMQIFSRVSALNQKRDNTANSVHTLAKRNLLNSVINIVNLRKNFRRWHAQAKKMTNMMVNRTLGYLKHKSISLGFKAVIRIKKKFILRCMKKAMGRWAKYSGISGKIRGEAVSTGVGVIASARYDVGL